MPTTMLRSPIGWGADAGCSPDDAPPVLKIPAILPVNGAVIEQRRVAMGWTRAELASRAGISPTMVGRLESGRYRGTAREVIARIAKGRWIVLLKHVLAGP